MDKEQSLEIIKSLQKIVDQMKKDDLEESPEQAFELFQCDCCGEQKIMAGSLVYNDKLLCNDCVLIAEVGFKLNKIKNINELIKSMENKRFENIYNSIFSDEDFSNN